MIQKPRSNVSSEAFQGSNRAVVDEYSCELTVTSGVVPKTLNGSLYRNGPGRFGIGADVYDHLFDGDGMISSFRISNGRVHYRNAYVKTDEFKKEQAAGRMLYRGFGTNIPGGLWRNMFRTHFKNAANTNVVMHAGQLLALWEGGWPHLISPDDLTTLGRHSFKGILRNDATFIDRMVNPELPFSAHPKFDPTTGSLHNFGLVLGLKNRLMIYKIDQTGQFDQPRYLNLKRLSFIHDFVITAGSKAIFFLPTVQFNTLSMLTGLKSPAEGMKDDKREPVQILVVDLNGAAGEIPESAIEVYSAPHAFIFHHINAFEKNGEIHIYSAEMDSFPSAAASRSALRGEAFEYPLTRLAKYILVPGERSARREILTAQGFELPRIDESETGLEFQYFYAAGASGASQFPVTNQIQKVSIAGDVIAYFDYIDGLVGEPIFARTCEISYILTVGYNHRIGKSELLILRSSDLHCVATAELPHSLPSGFHGNWAIDAG